MDSIYVVRRLTKYKNAIRETIAMLQAIHATMVTLEIYHGNYGYKLLW